MRNPKLDLMLQGIILNAYRDLSSQSPFVMEEVDPRAVGIIAKMTQKPEPEAIMVLHTLHLQYPTCPDHLVPEIDKMIEVWNKRCENDSKGGE